MSDYYDRLEQQLMRATARPSPRARRAPIVLWRPRRDLFAVAAALAVVAIVAAIFIGLRPSTRRVEQPPAQHGLAVVHNYGNRAMPALHGYSARPNCSAAGRGDPLTAPRPALLQHPRSDRTDAAASTSQRHGERQRQAGRRGVLDRCPRPTAQSARWRLRGLVAVRETQPGRQLQPDLSSETHLRRDRHPARRRQRPATRARADTNPLGAAGDWTLPVGNHSPGAAVEQVPGAARARRLALLLSQLRRKTIARGSD